MVHRGFLEILHKKGPFYAIGGVLNENQGVPWIGKVCKSKFGQIWIIFGHYLAKFGHPIFFHWVKQKVKKVCGVRFVGYFFKKLSYWAGK